MEQSLSPCWVSARRTTRSRSLRFPIWEVKWLRGAGFAAKEGELIFVPAPDGAIAFAVLGLGAQNDPLALAAFSDLGGEMAAWRRFRGEGRRTDFRSGAGWSNRFRRAGSRRAERPARARCVFRSGR